MVRAARAPVAVLAFGLGALFLPPQTEDMVAALDDSLWKQVVFQASLIFLAMSAWFWSRTVLAALFEIRDADAPPKRDFRLRRTTASVVDQRAFDWLPRGLFAGAAFAGIISLPWSESLASGSVAVVWLLVALTGFRMRKSKFPRLVNKRVPDVRRADQKSVREGKWTAVFPVLRALTWHPFDTIWRRLLKLFDYAPISRLVGRLSLALGIFAFVAGGVESFLPAGILPNSWPGFAALCSIWFPGPSVALIGLGLMIGPLTALTFVADAWHTQIHVGATKIGPRRPPVLLLLGIWIFIFVPYRWDMHAVRTYVPDKNGAPALSCLESRRPLEELLKAWNECAVVPPDQPLHPVLVAVSGGATRAGLWGMRVLQKIEEAADNHGHNVFVVSSVSGGSLGAAAYMALRASMTDEKGCPGPLPSTRTDEKLLVLGGDALGPLLAGRLLGDLPRGLLAVFSEPIRWLLGSPTKIHRGGDSAEAIERGFERLWRPTAESLGAVSFDKSFLSLFYQADKLRRGMPIWIANGTDALTGNRIVTVPFRSDVKSEPNDCRNWPIRGAKDALGLLEADVPISTTINNTARFPFLEPAGTMLSQADGKGAGVLIDGGYFENEGLETALDIAEWLDHCGSFLVGRWIDPIIVQVTGDGEGDGQDVVRCSAGGDGPVTPSTGSVLQLLAPIAGIYNVRGGHSTASLHQVRGQYCPPNSPHFFHFYLPALGGKNVPLDWILSTHVAKQIWTDAMKLAGNDRELDALKSALRK